VALMVIDTAALIAILLREPDAQLYAEAIHPAGLTVGDCLSYALARTSGHPMLFNGNDFAQTDIRWIPQMP
jgi:ribonuclease VapC